jgi:NAD(P)-dependent dehydrogenase (short-subunit alcohol dehydrogenase family)
MARRSWVTGNADLFDLTGKVAVVTGGSRGIGYMIAAGLLRAGAKVYLSSRKTAELEVAAEQLGEFGDVTAIAADISSESGAAELAGAISAFEPQVHALFNNAGAAWGAPLAEFPDKGWDKVLDVNVRGVFHLTVALLPRLRAAAGPDDPARVVNIGSIDGIRVPGRQFQNFSYSASKAAVHMLTRHLAAELAPEILVNAIAPGPFESRMMAGLLAEHGDAIRDRSPLRRIGRPDDMAGIAVFLASRASTYITGAVIPVDGGISTTG